MTAGDIPKLTQRTEADLLKLVCELAVRTSHNTSIGTHEAYWEARHELESRLIALSEEREKELREGWDDGLVYAWMSPKSNKAREDEFFAAFLAKKKEK